MHHSNSSRNSYSTSTGTHHYSTAGMAANHFSTKAAASTAPNTSFHHQQHRMSAPAPTHTTTGIPHTTTTSTIANTNVATSSVGNMYASGGNSSINTGKFLLNNSSNNSPIIFLVCFCFSWSSTTISTTSISGPPVSTAS